MKPWKNKKYFWEYALLFFAILIFAISFILRERIINKTSLSSQAKYFEKEIKKSENDFAQVLKDSALLTRLIQAKESFEDIISLYQKTYFFYIYNETGNNQYLRMWSTGRVLPTKDLLAGPPIKKMSLLPNGYYYVIKQPLPNRPDFFVYCLILVKLNFFIETEYFRNTFAFNKSLDKTVDISFEPTPYPVKALDGKTQFYFKQKPNSQLNRDNDLSLGLRLTGLLLFFLSLYLLLSKHYTQWNTFANIYIFLACLITFRILAYVTNIIFDHRRLTIFDADIYGPNIFLPSLGDFLINSILFCWLAVFLWNRIVSWPNKKIETYSESKRKIIGFTFLLLLVLATFAIAYMIRSIIADSKISFDVTNFFSLNYHTAIGFVILVCLSLGFYYLSKLLFFCIFDIFKKSKLLIYLSISVLGLLFISVFVDKTTVDFYLPCLLWLIIYTLLFSYDEKINALFQFNISGIILWIFIFSISIAFLMLTEINRAELASRRTYIEKLATQTDPASDRLISIANRYLDDNFFRQNFNRLYNETENSVIRDSIASRNYWGYLNQYNTSIYFYDSLNHPLYNPDGNTLETLNSVIKLQSKPTSFSDIYFYEFGYDKFSYITRRIIRNADSSLKGSVFIISNPKKFGGASISPELFRQAEQWELSNSPIYQYAIYKDGILTESSKNYPFTYSLTKEQLPLKRFEIREENGYNELWYMQDINKTIVISRKSQKLLEAITLFSYIFGTFLIVIALISLFSIVLRSITNNKRFDTGKLIFSSIRSQIHGTYILIIIFSFLVIGVASISFVYSRYENVNNEKLSRTLNIMLNELQTRHGIDSLISNEHSLTNSSVKSENLGVLIKTISNIHGVDVNIYDLTGNLRATSQPDVYNRGILSKQISPRAFYQMLRLRKIEHYQKESISNLSYTTIYGPIRNREGQIFAFLSIPYFTSQLELNQEISDFFVTLINLIAFIFVITGMIAMLIANRITKSFKLISNKMKEVSLSKVNEPIIWQRDDEIGELVKEYNKMVIKLQESANSIVKSERDVAWREMARQVAHEIKNPLTPMKLSLQYLQKAINEGNPNIQELTSRVSKTIVEQIDHLAKIAADFSQFANINTSNKRILNLHEIIQPLIEIHSKNADIQLKWMPIKGELNIIADKTQMNRLFSNLLVNAFDACAGKENCKIEFKEKIDKNNVIISISDNGSGIPDEMKNKIFIPNFTTKSSGTGLGLAMCKNIVEQSGGAIWFETVINEGTTFFVTLPLIDS